jgi:PAS domain S-box-containing protein
MVGFTEGGRIVLHNHPFRSLLGYTPQELTNRNYLTLVLEEDRQEEGEVLPPMPSEGGAVESNRRLVHKNGHPVPVSQSITLLPGPEKILLCTIVPTDAGEAQTEMRNRERRYRCMAEGLCEMFSYELDDKGQFSRVSPACRKVLGWRPEELLGHRWDELFQGADGETLPGLSQLSAVSQRPVRVTTLNHKGARIYLELSHDFHRTPEGVPCWLGLARDITRGRHIDGKLLLSREILHSIDSLVLVADEQGEILYVSPAVAHIMKCRLQDLLGGGWWRHAHPVSDEAVAAQRSAAELACGERPAAEKNWEQELHDREGARHWIQWRERRGGKRLAIYSGTDITACKWAEVALRARTEQLAGLIDNCPIGIVIVGREGQIQTCNRAFEQIFGYSEGDVRGKRFSQFLSPDEYSQTMERMKERLAAGEVGSAYMSFRRQDGAQVDIEMQAVPLRSNGRTVGHYTLFTDITERLHSEQALQQSERQLRAIFDCSLDGMFLIGRDGRCVDVNPAGCHLLARPKDEIIERPMGYFSTQDHKQQHLELMNGNEDVPQQITIARPDGEQRLVEFSLTRGILHGLNLLVTHDRTEYVELENRLLQSQKMEAIGRLAGGVAHDINNMLTVIRGYSELMVKKLPGSHPLIRYAQSIVSAADRSSMVTQQLLAFSRRQVVMPQIVGVNTVISEILKLIQRLIGEDIELRVELDKEAGRVKVDPSQMGQVLMNLAVNARDAMPRGGWLHIRTQPVTLPEASSGEPLHSAGPYTCVEVCDNGCGMNSDLIAHIFEPFFTTKECGKGTGLGLSTVYGIVKQCGGWVEVESQIGIGTTFRVYLPRLTEDGDAQEPASVAGLEENNFVLPQAPVGNELKAI